jgi:hypothetical protein
MCSPLTVYRASCIVTQGTNVALNTCIYHTPVLHSGYMNKKLGIIIVIILLLLLGGGALVMSKQSSTSMGSKLAITAVNPTETKTENTGTLGSLKNLMTSGVPQSCTFTGQKENTTTGTIYVSDKQLRADFTSTNEGQKITGHMIVDNGYSYVWTDLMKRGMKVALTQEQIDNGAINSQTVDLNQTVSYVCKPWTSDTAKFTIPADITFSTVTLPKAATSPAGTGTSGVGTAGTSCSACESLPEAAQSACRTQLNCK